MTKSEASKIDGKLDRILNHLYKQDARLDVIDEKLESNSNDHAEMKPVLKNHQSDIDKLKGGLALITVIGVGSLVASVKGLFKL